MANYRTLGIMAGLANGMERASMNLMATMAQAYQLKQNKERFDQETKINNLKIKQLENELSPDMINLMREQHRLKIKQADLNFKVAERDLTNKSKGYSDATKKMGYMYSILKQQNQDANVSVEFDKGQLRPSVSNIKTKSPIPVPMTEYQKENIAIQKEKMGMQKDKPTQSAIEDFQSMISSGEITTREQANQKINEWEKGLRGQGVDIVKLTETLDSMLPDEYSEEKKGFLGVGAKPALKTKNGITYEKRKDGLWYPVNK